MVFSSDTAMVKVWFGSNPKNNGLHFGKICVQVSLTNVSWWGLKSSLYLTVCRTKRKVVVVIQVHTVLLLRSKTSNKQCISHWTWRSKHYSRGSTISFEHAKMLLVQPEAILVLSSSAERYRLVCFFSEIASGSLSSWSGSGSEEPNMIHHSQPLCPHSVITKWWEEWMESQHCHHLTTGKNLAVLTVWQGASRTGQIIQTSLDICTREGCVPIVQCIEAACISLYGVLLIA